MTYNLEMAVVAITFLLPKDLTQEHQTMFLHLQRLREVTQYAKTICLPLYLTTRWINNLPKAVTQWCLMAVVPTQYLKTHVMLRVFTETQPHLLVLRCLHL